MKLLMKRGDKKKDDEQGKAKEKDNKEYTKKLETWKENEGKEIKQASEEAGEGTPGEEGSEEVVVASIYIAKNVLIEDGDME